jgi:putative transport protein
LEPADVVRAVGTGPDVEALAKKIGREERRLDETSLLPFVAGIAAGIFLGKLPIPLPGGVVVSLGMAGGPFTIALILARLGRIGPISAYVPNAAKFLARDLGLILFLAGTGAKAGSTFFAVLGHVGPMVVVAGALISLVAVATSFTLTFKIMKWNLLTAAGALSATMFNPPALAATSELAPSPAPALGFASVYPISMISTIAAAQVLVLIMNAIK